jgi:hypothetical protein
MDDTAVWVKGAILCRKRAPSVEAFFGDDAKIRWMFSIFSNFLDSASALFATRRGAKLDKSSDIILAEVHTMRV